MPRCAIVSLLVWLSTVCLPVALPAQSGAVNVLAVPGADIGAKINAACAQLATGGTAALPVGTFTFTTPIVITTGCNIRGQGKGATILRYTAATGTGITYSGGTDSAPAGYGLKSLTYSGPGGRNTATGLLIAYPGFEVADVEIGAVSQGFNVGVTFGNNAYLDYFLNSSIWQNNQNLVYPDGLRNSGENISFVNTVFGNGTLGDDRSTGLDCVDILGSGATQNVEFSFVDVSFDGCQVVIGQNPMQVRFVSPHFEDNLKVLDYPYLIVSSANSRYSTVTLISPTFFVDAPTMTAPSLVELNGYAKISVPSGATYFGYGGTSGPKIAAFYAKGKGSAQLFTSGAFTGNLSGNFPTLYSSDGINNLVATNAVPGAQKSINVPSAGGTFVIADTAISQFLGGRFVLTYIGPNRQQELVLQVAAGRYASAPNLAVISNWVYSGNTILTSQIRSNGTEEQLAVVVANQGGNPGALTVQYIGDGYSAANLLTGATAFDRVLATGGAGMMKTLANCGIMTTTAAESDSLSCAWVTTASNCAITPNNSNAVPFTYYTAAAGSVTVHHAATAGATYGIACSAN